MNGQDILTPPWRTARQPQEVDRRVKRTRGLLISALMSLLKEKPLRAITVRELTERADVNRATFYAHYHDIYDMCDQIRCEFTQMFDELITIHATELEQGHFKPMLQDVFDYIDDNEDVFLAFFAGNAGDTDDIAHMLKVGFLHSYASEHVAQKATSTSNDQMTADAFIYQFDYIAGGLVNMIKSWLSKHNRESACFMAELATRFLEQTVVA